MESSDWHNDEGIIRQANAQGMGIALMRPMTNGVVQRLMAHAFAQIDVLDVGRLLLNYVLSDPYVDVALIGMREPRFVEINNAISDDVGSRIDPSRAYSLWAALLFNLFTQETSWRRRRVRMTRTCLYVPALTGHGCRLITRSATSSIVRYHWNITAMSKEETVFTNFRCHPALGINAV